MFQREMFSDSFDRSAVFLGAGVSARAHRLSNGLVAKVAVNDRTRNWLEYCMLAKERGELLPLMPTVHKVVDVGTDSYMAIMDEYLHYSVAGKERLGNAVQELPEFQAVLDGFREYILSINQYASAGRLSNFGDTHSGNVMFTNDKHKLPIITDPAGASYVKAIEQEFTLH